MEEFLDEVKRHIFIIFGSDHYNTLGALRSIGEFGGTVDLILHPKYRKKACLVNNSKYSVNSKIHYVRDIEEGFDVLMRYYSNQTVKPFLISCDDWSTCYFDEHIDVLKANFYYFGGNQNGIINQYINKYNAGQLCLKYGIKIPNSIVAKKGEDMVSIGYPIITKSVASTIGGWKNDVHICHSKQELLDAYKKIESEEVLLSQFIRKKHELNIAGFSINNGMGGVYMPFQMTSLRAPEGTYGHYIQIEPFEDEKIKVALKKVIEDTSYSGIFSVDMLVDGDNNTYFLEINFRHSAFTYACNYGGINLIKEWALALMQGGFDEKSLNSKRITRKYKAIAESNDFIQNVVNKRISFTQWVYDVLCADVHFYFHHKDVKPFFAFIKSKLNNK